MNHLEVSLTREIFNRYENYAPNDYSLECLIDENKYFIVSPKDVVAANLYSSDDRVKWLLEHE
jgi:vacuolar protein sorting-associated protein 41